MNENLNLSEILKDCPKGTKFYSTLYGEIYFDSISGAKYPVKFTLDDGSDFCVTSKGLYFSGYGECIVFPSKYQRDWSKWHLL